MAKIKDSGELSDKEIIKMIRETYLKGCEVITDAKTRKVLKTILGDKMYPEYSVIKALEMAVALTREDTKVKLSLISRTRNKED